MQITIYGASGKVGRLVVELALERGYQVVAFVHSSPPFTEHNNLRIVKGDIYNAKDVATAVKGSEAVISTLGSWGTPKKDVLTSGMQHIIPAMQSSGMRRIISLTGSDARAAGDSKSLIHRFSHTAAKIGAGKILADGERHIMLLEESDLDWTVVRSPIMNNRGDAPKFALTNERPMPWATINRRSVAQCMVDLSCSSEHQQEAQYITRI